MSPGGNNGSVAVAQRKRRLKAFLGVATAVAVALILIATYLNVQEGWAVRSVSDIDEAFPLFDMAIDRFGQKHVLRTVDDWGVRYTMIGGGHNLDASAQGIVGLSLDVDQLGHGHFAVVAETIEPDRYYVAYYTNSASESKPVASDVAPFAPSVAVDASGYVHITYSMKGNLTYSTNAGGVWTQTTILSSGLSSPEDPYESDYRTAVDVDSDGHIHICYGISSTYIGYITNASGVWAGGPVKNFDEGGSSFDMALDSEDNVHVCYNGPLNDTVGVIHAQNSGSGWEHDTAIELEQFDGVRCSIAADAPDSVRIACAYQVSQESGYRIQCSEKHGGEWREMEVASSVSGLASADCRLALDPDGGAYVAFVEDGTLRYATDSPDLAETLWLWAPGIVLAAAVAVVGAWVVSRLKVAV